MAFNRGLDKIFPSVQADSELDWNSPTIINTLTRVTWDKGGSTPKSLSYEEVIEGLMC